MMKEHSTYCLSEHAKRRLRERFLSYAAVCTTSSSEQADKGVMPSTPGQREFARMLLAELQALGADEAYISEYGYVCARLKPSSGCEHAPAVGLCAHLDTSEEVPAGTVHPRVIEHYDGSVIALGGGAVLDPAADAELARAKGLDIITTDGTTLLGADDKAGIAEIMTVLEFLTAQPDIPHGPVEVIFSPDEETGHGMDHVPLDWIQAKQFYTLDGSSPPEIETECFNAYRCDVTFTGIAAHTGSARPHMINAVSMAADFITSLPRHEAPETTDGRQGFFAPMEIQGQLERARTALYLRDFSAEGMEQRIQTVRAIAAAIQAKYRGSTVSVQTAKQYLNMKQTIDAHPLAAELLVQAVRTAGLEPRFVPIRGGTDGARLAEAGIPCPNIFTGGHNFHSRTEWACIQHMEQAAETLLQLIRLWALQPAEQPA